MKRDLRFIYRHLLTLTTAALFMTAIPAQENKLIVDWNKVEHVSKTTATLQVVENPMVRPPSPIHQGTFKALKTWAPTMFVMCPGSLIQRWLLPN